MWSILRRVVKTTLITLFVLAVIGIIALPTCGCGGSQSRARDGWRKASLSNAAEIFSMTRSFYGEFPTATGTWKENDTGTKNCLSDSGWRVPPDLAKFFRGGVAPLDPQRANKAGNCTESGAYGYFPLQKDGTNRASFLLVADVETEKKANYDYCDENGNLRPGWSGLGDGSPRTRFDEWVSSETYGTGLVFPESPQGKNGKCSQYVVIGRGK